MARHFWRVLVATGVLSQTSAVADFGEIADDAPSCVDNVWCEIETFGVVGGDAEWRVLLEHESASYRLEEASGPWGPWSSVVGTWPAGSVNYAVSGVAGGPFYRLVEKDVAGNELVVEFARAMDPLPVYSPPPAPTLTELRAVSDSLLAIHIAQGPSAPLVGSGTVVVYGPLNLLAEANGLKAMWELHGYTVVLRDVGPFGDPNVNESGVRSAIKADIAAHAANGVEYFLLLGDASPKDAWAASSWTGDWPAQRSRYVANGFPDAGQPSLNIIPTFVEYDLRTPRSSMTRWWPFFVTDQPYGCIDGDDVPDVVVTRIPAGDPDEARAGCNRAVEYPLDGGGPGMNNPMAYAYDYVNMSDPARSASVVRAWVSSLGLPVAVHYAFDVGGEANLGLHAVGELNDTRPDLAIIVGTNSHRYAPGKNFSKRWGFHAGMLAASRATVVVAPVCGSADFATPEDSNYGTPTCEDFLLHTNWDEGAIAWVGPSSGSWQYANFEFANEFLAELQSSPSEPMSKAWLVALERASETLALSDEMLRTIRSYVFLGDPLSRMLASSGPPLGAPDRLSSERIRMVLGPNPSPQGGSLRLSLPESAQVSVRIYDVRGRLVRVVADTRLEAGDRTLDWDGRDSAGQYVAGGVYFVVAHVGDQRLTRKVTLLR